MLAPLWVTLLACTSLPDTLKRPNDLALGPDGEVYVSDFLHDRIAQFDADGRFVRTFGSEGTGRGQLFRIFGLAVDRDGSLLVVNRRPEGGVDRDQVFEVKRFRDGKQVALYPISAQVGDDAWIQSVARGPDDTFLLANAFTGEVIQMSEEWILRGRFGPVPALGDSPSFVLEDGDSWWVLEQYNHRLSRFDAHGRPTRVLVIDAGHGPLRFPRALAVCHDEWFAVADMGNHRVQRYDMNGQWIGGFEPERAGPDAPVQLMDIALTDDCSRLYLVDSKGNRVLVTTPEGEVLQELSSW